MKQKEQKFLRWNAKDRRVKTNGEKIQERLKIEIKYKNVRT